MKRMAVLGCASLLLAGCAGGGDDDEFREELADSIGRIADAIVEELGRTEPPEPELIPALNFTGEYGIYIVDGFTDSYTSTSFYEWGLWAQLVREDVVTCLALDCVPEGEETLFKVYLDDTDVGEATRAAARAQATADAFAAGQVQAEATVAAAEDEVTFLVGELADAVANQAAAEDQAELALSAAAAAHAAWYGAIAGGAPESEIAELQAQADAAQLDADAAADAAAAAAYLVNEAEDAYDAANQALAYSEHALAEVAAVAAAAALAAEAAAAALAIAQEFDVITVVEGIPSGTSPVSGSAVWNGSVLAYESEDVSFQGSTVTTYLPVTGTSRLEVDFTAVTVDVDFTSFDNGQADMSWDALTMDNGVFGYGTTTIDGSFYGANHEGAAGTFDRDGLTGVFGAIRDSDEPVAVD